MAAKDLYEKDYYAILGVEKSADSDEIKKRYRKLARELHPDKTKGDKTLEERFKAVSEAYDILSDEKKRAEYDQARTLFQQGGVPNGGFQGNFSAGGFGDLGDIFGNLFGGQRGPRRGADMQAQATISFRESISGTQLTFNSPSGPVTTKIPAGVNDGAKIRVRGKGAPGEAGAGDLYITINVAPHSVFSRKEENLLLTLPVTFPEAALGANISVPTLSGEEVTLRLPAGTANGKTLRIKGRGITRKDGSAGDLLVTIEVSVPQRVDGKAKKALESYQEESKGADPREDLRKRARS
ncbi:MAG: molecular chaperone DnaJ [Actinobacteria bacterium]|nr:molecular chaperone DnaJ [Actinomycetota bacterium]